MQQPAAFTDGISTEVPRGESVDTAQLSTELPVAPQKAQSLTPEDQLRLDQMEARLRALADQSDRVVLSVSVGAAPRFFPPGSVTARPGTVPISQWSRELLRAARQAEHPLNAGLMIEALVSRGRLALMSPQGR